jgi:hypothetical protein
LAALVFELNEKAHTEIPTDCAVAIGNCNFTGENIPFYQVLHLLGLA